jgi:hypothetical protein
VNVRTPDDPAQVRSAPEQRVGRPIEGSDLSDGLGSTLSRLLKAEAVALVAAFALLVAGTAALADRYVDDSGELLRKTAAGAERNGTYRFTTSQSYSGPYARSATTGSGVQLSGAVDVRAGVSRFDTLIKLPGVSAKCTYISDGENLFVSVHPSRRNTLGASWLRTTATGPLANAALQGIRPDELNTRAARLFEGLEADGTVVVRGVETTKYKGAVDIAALAGSATDKALAEVGRTLPVEVYVDDDDLLRRVAIVITAQKSFSVRFTTDLYDYGKPLDIRLPSGSSVKPASTRDIALACYPATFPTTTNPRAAGRAGSR